MKEEEGGNRREDHEEGGGTAGLYRAAPIYAASQLAGSLLVANKKKPRANAAEIQTGRDQGFFAQGDAENQKRLNEVGQTYMWAILEGTMRRSSPTRALPVARTLFSPLAVSGMSVFPVWRPSSDHSVSPWRMMKTRGVVMACFQHWAAGRLLSPLLLNKFSSMSVCRATGTCG